MVEEVDEEIVVDIEDFDKNMVENMVQNIDDKFVDYTVVDKIDEKFDQEFVDLEDLDNNFLVQVQ